MVRKEQSICVCDSSGWLRKWSDKHKLMHNHTRIEPAHLFLLHRLAILKEKLTILEDRSHCYLDVNMLQGNFSHFLLLLLLLQSLKGWLFLMISNLFCLCPKSNENFTHAWSSSNYFKLPSVVPLRNTVVFVWCSLISVRVINAMLSTWDQNPFFVTLW